MKFLVGWGGYCPSSIPLALPMPRWALSYLIFHIHDFFSAYFSLFTSSSAISLWASESNTLIFFLKIEFIHPEVLKSFTSSSTWALKYFSPTLCIFDIYDLRAFGLSTLMFELSSFSKPKWAMCQSLDKCTDKKQKKKTDASDSSQLKWRICKGVSSGSEEE